MPTDTSKCPLDRESIGVIIVKVHEEHQPEPGGCTCGFCVYSANHVEHYVIEALMAVLESYWREKVVLLIEAAESHQCTGGHCSIRAALARLTEETK